MISAISRSDDICTIKTSFGFSSQKRNSRFRVDIDSKTAYFILLSYIFSCLNYRQETIF